MNQPGCSFSLFFRLLILLGLLILLFSLLPRAACYWPNWWVYVVGCFFTGVGLLGHIGSLVWFRLDWGKSPVNRHWLHTWPIACSFLMLGGVVVACLSVQFAHSPSLSSLFGPDTPLAWPYLQWGGVFCLTVGLFTLIASLVIRRDLLDYPRLLSEKENRLRGLLLLGVVLLAGVIVIPVGMPMSYCQAEWDCRLISPTRYAFSIKDDVCASQRYTPFWPPTVDDPYGTGFCRATHGHIEPECVCRQNRCVPNPNSGLK